MWVKSHQKSKKCSEYLVWKGFSYKNILRMIYLQCGYFLLENPTIFSSMHIEKLLGTINCILEHIYQIQVIFFINAHWTYLTIRQTNFVLDFQSGIEMWVKSHQKSKKCSESLVWKEYLYKLYYGWFIYIVDTFYQKIPQEKLRALSSCIYLVHATFFINAHRKTTFS